MSPATDLATRCPHCLTAFRVEPEQLKLRGGRVRCGVCNEVFDATQHMVGSEDKAGALEAVLSPSPPASAPKSEIAKALPPDGIPVVVRRRGEPEPRIVVPETEIPEASRPVAPPLEFPPDEPEPAAPSEPALFRAPGSVPAAGAGNGEMIDALLDALGKFSPASLPPPAARPEAELPEEPEPFPKPYVAPFAAPARPAPEPRASFMDEGAGKRGRLRWLWWLGAVLLLLLAIGQALWTFRAEVAVRMPGLRPLLEELCAPLQCTVGYPHAPELLSIESSALEPWEQAAHPDGAPEVGAAATGTALPVRRLALRVVLRNRAEFPQEWPALELALTDLSEAATARRVLLPTAYLTAQQLARPLGAGEQQTLLIPIEAIDTPASGYRLAVFYP